MIFCSNFNIKSNPSKIPKYIKLIYFIEKPSALLNRTIKLLIPNKKLRKKVIQVIENINYRKFEKPELKFGRPTGIRRGKSSRT